ncbi:MAG: PspC domain-containing protein [Acutalibacteraceae bacterium]|nr:PspC domain-containing protein [Oscillospiraceae bacterium]
MKKTLYRVNENKMIAGVCAGFAEYFDVDVTWIRLALVLFSLMGGCGLVAYLVAAIIMPVKPDSIV